MVSNRLGRMLSFKQRMVALIGVQFLATVIVVLADGLGALPVMLAADAVLLTVGYYVL